MASDAQIIAEWRALAPTLKARVTELLDRVEKSEAELDAIILRCLQKEPDQRFQSARQVVDALSNLVRPS